MDFGWCRVLLNYKRHFYFDILAILLLNIFTMNIKAKIIWLSLENLVNICNNLFGFD